MRFEPAAKEANAMTDADLGAIEQSALNAVHIGVVKVMAVEPQQVLDLVDEVRRLRAAGGWNPPTSSIVSMLRAMEYIQDHLSELLLLRAETLGTTAAQPALELARDAPSRK